MKEDGKTTRIGFFNPTSPKGLSSQTLTLNYGDKCPETNDYREGEVRISCGDELAVTSKSMIADCRYLFTVTTPELCSAKDHYYYLDGTSVEANDGGWWNYRVNFFKHKSVGSTLFQFHSDGAHSERIKLGEIMPTLNSDGVMYFEHGEPCETTKLPRSGTINVECGCDYEVKELSEPEMCKFEFVISHPKACETAPKDCDSTTLKAQLIEKKRKSKMMTVPADWDEIYSTRMDKSKFPRDLLHPHYTENKYWEK